MAIFIASTKSISRAKGQSAVASASYRAGEKLYDERHGKTHNYESRKRQNDVLSADIIMPENLKELSISRAELWNLAEKSEKRKDARVGREWLINLPHELDEQTRQNLAHDFTKKLVERYGVIADCAIHRPSQKEIDRGADPRNFHAHILLTTRQAELQQNGKIVLDKKADSELSDSDRKKKGLCRMSEEINEVRELWETLANEKLAEFGAELIDRRSYQELGIDRLPQLKMGAGATALERDGRPTEKGNINREILEYNELVFNRELEHIEQTNSQADSIIFESRKRHDERAEQQRITDNRISFVNQITQRAERIIANTANSQHQIGRAEQQIDRAERLSSTAKQRIAKSQSFIDESERRIADTKLRLSNSELRIKDNEQVIDESKQRATSNTEQFDINTTRIANSTYRIAESERIIAESNQAINSRDERQRQQQLEAEQREQTRLAEQQAEEQLREQAEEQARLERERLEEQKRQRQQAEEQLREKERMEQDKALRLLRYAREGIKENNAFVDKFKEMYPQQRINDDDIEKRRKILSVGSQGLDFYEIEGGLSTFKLYLDGTISVNEFSKTYSKNILTDRNHYELSDICELKDDNLYFKKMNVYLPIQNWRDTEQIQKILDTSLSYQQKMVEESKLKPAVTRVYEPQNEEINNRKNDSFDVGF